MDKGTNVGNRPGGAERPQESGTAAPGRGGRISRQRKTAAVTIEEVRQALLVFREIYNTTWFDRKTQIHQPRRVLP